MLDGFPRWLSGQESTCQWGDAGVIPGLAIFPGEGNDTPLQYSCLKNLTIRGACGLQSLMLQKSWPPLSDWACVLEEGKPLIQFGWYLYKKNATWQDKRAHRERAMWRQRQRWGEAATSPGTPKIASKPPEARREPWLRFSLTAFRRYQPWHLDLRLVASRTVRQ